MIGLFFGSFNPVHNGHLYVVNQALNSGLFDKIIVIPANQNSFKDNYTVSFEHRFNMCRAFNTLKVSVSRIESDLNLNYTVDTLNYFVYSGLIPVTQIAIITTDETYKEIKSWKNGEYILSFFKFFIVNRNKDDISSSRIRNYIKENKSIFGLVPKHVENYINNFNLYK